MIENLGHFIQPRPLEIATPTTDAIKGLKQPTIITELRYFLGLYNFFRRFVPYFAHIAVPLIQKLKKDLPKLFGPLSMDELKAMHNCRTS